MGSKNILLFLKGIGMGAADVVPGVSGGTIAFISGIYEELISSIQSINPQAFRVLINKGIREFWRHINGNFLLSLLLGIAVSIFSLAGLIRYLMKEYPVGLWAFFFGLVIASVIFLFKDIEKKKLSSYVMLVIGCILALWISTLPPLASKTNSLLFILISAVIAICAMILPGISGAFILLLLGAYDQVLYAVETFDLSVLSVFAFGAIFGLLAFSNVLKWLYKNYKNSTISLLTGFVAGSLYKLWPWKNVIEYHVDSHGKSVPLIEENVLPSEFLGDANILQAIVMLVIGFALIFILESIAKSMRAE